MAKSFFLRNLIFTEGRTFFILNLVVFLIFSFFSIFSYFNYPNLFLIFFLFSILTFMFFIFLFYFFRNPDRIQQHLDEDIIICPADGKVIDIVHGDFDGFNQKVSIFLSPLDVHVNWISITGKILETKYKSGQFIAAFVPKSSILNERNDIIIQDSKKRNILLRQIAGTLARRIVCWVNTGDNVKIGQKYGMIKFSSRVDVLLPKNVSLNVKLNQRVMGGNTILGRWI